MFPVLKKAVLMVTIVVPIVLSSATATANQMSFHSPHVQKPTANYSVTCHLNLNDYDYILAAQNLDRIRVLDIDYRISAVMSGLMIAVMSLIISILICSIFLFRRNRPLKRHFVYLERILVSIFFVLMIFGINRLAESYVVDPIKNTVAKNKELLKLYEYKLSIMPNTPKIDIVNRCGIDDSKIITKLTSIATDSYYLIK